MRLPNSNSVSVRPLSGAFRRTTNSYKYYWFLAIIEHVREGDSLVVTIDDLLSRMIAAVWYPVNYFRLSFGKQDRLEKIAKRVKTVGALTDDSTRRDVRKAIESIVNRDTEVSDDVRSLGRYVPFRFLTPWFDDKLRGIPDHKKNARIQQLAATSFSDQNPPLYRFRLESPGRIELHPSWDRYLQRHQRIARDFCLWNLLAYLRKKNPNVPDIATKLFRPKTRRLRTARRFWNLYLTKNPGLSCLYSGKVLVRNGFAIDHFLPWRFISHDQLWNLVPVTQSANVRKTDSLPDLETYFDSFAELQYASFKTALRANWEKSLEDYALLFSDDLTAIGSLHLTEFRSRLYSCITPLEQIAANMGFDRGWVYEG
jgi:5-methylcytosine-specific restriction endonuclease McrA